MLAFTGSASALNGNRTGPTDGKGFPHYYTDVNGRSLQLCDDGSFQCQRVKRESLVPPEGEAVYWAALATIRSNRGPIDVEMALEAAFAGPRGRPLVFSRLRIRGHLRQSGGYILDYPYGSKRFRAITPQEDRNVDTTVDRGCSLKRGGGCAKNRPTWLRSVNRAQGYMGRLRRTRVTGGTERNNLVLRTSDGDVIGSTSKFRIIGKVCGDKCRVRARRN